MKQIGENRMLILRFCKCIPFYSCVVLHVSHYTMNFWSWIIDWLNHMYTPIHVAQENYCFMHTTINQTLDFLKYHHSRSTTRNKIFGQPFSSCKRERSVWTTSHTKYCIYIIIEINLYLWSAYKISFGFNEII